MRTTPKDYLKAKFGGKPKVDIDVYQHDDPHGSHSCPDIEELLEEYLAINTDDDLSFNRNKRSEKVVVGNEEYLAINTDEDLSFNRNKRSEKVVVVNATKGLIVATLAEWPALKTNNH